MGFGIATQTGVSAAIQSIPSFMSNKGLRNGYGATFAENFTDGTNVLDPRITFSRASNATVVGSDGLIQYAPNNLMPFSEQFDNSAWSKANITVTANTTLAPNGTATADSVLFIGGGVASGIWQNFSYTAGFTYTQSIYLKYIDQKWIQLTFGSTPFGGSQFANFDIESGVLGSFSGGTPTIVPVENGWYRCTFSAVCTTTGSGSACNTLAVDSGTSARTSALTASNKSAYHWGAQLNVGSLQSYNTTTVKNLLGFSEAFENAAWTKSNSFIQTNLLTFSEQFDNAAWTKSNATVTANATLAPNGSTTADKLVEDTSTGGHVVIQSIAGAPDNTIYTSSCYVKPDGRSWVAVTVSDKAGNNNRVWYDVTTGTQGTTNGTVSAFSATNVGNGWYRISVSASSSTGASSVQLRVSMGSADNTASYTGDGTSGIFLWGAQLVQGSVAGDYQQTTSAALPVQYQAPNGTMTADKLVENTATNLHFTLQAATIPNGTPFTASAYLKAGERTFARIRLGDAGFVYEAVINLSTGVVTSTNGTGTNSVTSVGNGWYRVSCTGTVVSGNIASIGVYLRTNATTENYTGDGTSGIYIWGAQLSDSASLDQYVNNPVAAPSSTAYYGPRFDYDPVTLQPRGLLIEEQRTNLILRSNDLATSPWFNASLTSIANNTTEVTSPAGDNTATKIVATGGSSAVGQPVTLTAAVYTGSIWLRSASGNISAQLIVYLGASPFTNIGTQSITITPTWQRFTVTTSTATAASYNLQLNGIGAGTVYAWGAQLEAGAFSTSYIPTTTAQVTRSADVALVQGSNFSSWFNVNEGSVFVAGSTFSGSLPATRRMIQIDDTTANNRLVLGYNATTSSRFIVQVGGASQADITSPISSSASSNEVVGAYKINDFIQATNGTLGTADSSGTVPTVSRMVLGADESGNASTNLNGHIRQVAYYPRRLQNSELQAITS